MALQQVAAALKFSVRETDILGRMGGEEFAVLLPNTLQPEAGFLAERICQAVCASSFEIPGASLTITISAGASALTEQMSSIDDLLRNADFAMYQAKRSGGNRVALYKDGFNLVKP
jgi:diguanylate cyclase (GGDEF)-like protein